MIIEMGLHTFKTTTAITHKSVVLHAMKARFSVVCRNFPTLKS